MNNDVVYNEGYLKHTRESTPTFFRYWCGKAPRATIVYVHGSAGNSADVTVLAELLAERSYRVIAFDLPGHGYSRLQPVAENMAFAVNLKILNHIYRSFKGPFVSLSSSGGAILALIYQQNLPEDHPVREQLMIFAEPGLSYGEETRDYIKSVAKFMSTPYRSLDDAVKAWDQSLLGKVRFANEQEKRKYIVGRLMPRGNSLYPAVNGNLVKRLVKRTENPRDLGLFKDKQAMNNPCLTLWGEHGVQQEESDPALATVFNHYQSVVIPGASHPLSLTLEEESKSILEFLDKQYGSA